MNIEFEIARMQKMKLYEMRDYYHEVFGEPTNSKNKAWMLKRIAWRLQSQEEGSLSARARERASELANEADVRMNPPRSPKASSNSNRKSTQTIPTPKDNRIPPPGTILSRDYKGETLQVKILPSGFEYDGKVYTSLSAVAKAITGSHCNGFQFFRLQRKGEKR